MPKSFFPRVEVDGQGWESRKARRACAAAAGVGCSTARGHVSGLRTEGAGWGLNIEQASLLSVPSAFCSTLTQLAQRADATRRAVVPSSQAVAYGCFLRDVESWVDTEYALLTPVAASVQQ